MGCARLGGRLEKACGVSVNLLDFGLERVAKLIGLSLSRGFHGGYGVTGGRSGIRRVER
jgi:hypothetical protein